MGWFCHKFLFKPLRQWYCYGTMSRLGHSIISPLSTPWMPASLPHRHWQLTLREDWLSLPRELCIRGQRREDSDITFYLVLDILVGQFSLLWGINPPTGRCVAFHHPMVPIDTNPRLQRPVQTHLLQGMFPDGSFPFLNFSGITVGTKRFRHLTSLCVLSSSWNSPAVLCSLLRFCTKVFLSVSC